MSARWIIVLLGLCICHNNYAQDTTVVKLPRLTSDLTQIDILGRDTTYANYRKRSPERAIFCRLEDAMLRRGWPVKMRLGTLEYVDKLEYGYGDILIEK